MSQTTFQGALGWVLMVTLIFAGGAIAHAQNEQANQPKDEQPQGKIVRIGPPGDSNVTLDGGADNQIQLDNEQPAELPKHWIGILGGPVGDELRAQIQIDVPEGQGVLVRQVVPGSPAEKAGVKVFDILLKANGANLADIRDLAELVQSQGENGGAIALDVLRRGQHESITLTPEARPDQLAGGLRGQDSQDFGFGGMGAGGPRMQFRMFAPGNILSNQNFSLSQMPNGVSVNIQKQNDEPAHITVRRGNDTWNIVGDEPSSLAQLPEDVQPFVEQLLAGGGQMQIPMPMMPNMPGMSPGIPSSLHDPALHDQLQKMERHLQQMQQQLEQQFGPKQDDKSGDSNADANNE